MQMMTKNLTSITQMDLDGLMILLTQAKFIEAIIYSMYHYTIICTFAVTSRIFLALPCVLVRNKCQRCLGLIVLKSTLKVSFFDLGPNLGGLKLTLILTNVWQTKNMILSSRSKAALSPQDSPIYSSNSTHVKG